MIFSDKGFLERRPDCCVRITKEQKAAVIEAVSHALLGEASLIDVVGSALDRYPTDRSCFTCDFYSATSGRCAANENEAVPAHVLEPGCSEHKGEGVPF